MPRKPCKPKTVTESKMVDFVSFYFIESHLMIVLM